MTLDVAPGGDVLDPGDGEPLWCAGSLLTSKATRAQTTGPLAVDMIDESRTAGDTVCRPTPGR